MALETQGLYGWPSPDAVDAAAADIASSGGEFDDKIADAAGDWTALSAAYRDGVGRDKAIKAFEIIEDHGKAVRSASGFIRDALHGFATDLQALLARRETVLVRVSSHQDSIWAGEEIPEWGYGSEASIQLAVDGLVADLKARADDCARKLNDITIEVRPGGGFMATPVGGALAGGVENAMELSEIASFGYTELHLIISTYVVEETTRNFSPWVRLWGPNGPDVGMGLWKYNTTTRTFVEVTWEEVQREGAWRPNWTPTDTKWRQWLASKSSWYGDYSASRPPGHWNAPSARPWYDVAGQTGDHLDDFRNAGNGTKLLKGGGAALTLVTVGITFAQERDAEYNELLQEHPDWSSDEVNGRANEVGAVKTAASTGLDVGAGMAGAAVGTMIGGPVGTLVGFGVGIGISWVMNESGITDWVGDRAVDAWDGAKDWVGGLFD